MQSSHGMMELSECDESIPVVDGAWLEAELFDVASRRHACATALDLDALRALALGPCLDPALRQLLTAVAQAGRGQNREAHEREGRAAAAQAVARTLDTLWKQGAAYQLETLATPGCEAFVATAAGAALPLVMLAEALPGMEHVFHGALLAYGGRHHMITLSLRAGGVQLFSCHAALCLPRIENQGR